MPRLFVVAVSLMVLAASPSAARDERSQDCAAIVAALESSAAAWSRGDLDGFMRVYEASPETIYIGGADPVRGFDAIRAMYAARFGGGAASTGRLSLSVLDCRALGADHALVLGRFRLDGPSGPSGGSAGTFTLVFHRGAAGWRVISDHSSP